MKKLFSIILTISILFSSLATPVYAEEVQNNIIEMTNYDSSEDSNRQEDNAIGKIEILHLDEEDFAVADRSEIIMPSDDYESLYGDVALTASYSSSEYYGSQLSGIAKDMYSAINNINVENNGFSVTYSLGSMSFNEAFDYYEQFIRAAMSSYMYDHPAKMYFNTNNGYSYGASSWGGTITLKAAFLVSEYYKEDLEQKAEAVVTGIVEGITSNKRYEQVKYIHDWLVSKCCYDQDALTESNDSEHSYFAHGPIGCLVNKTGVCESYAKAFKIICDRLNIPCVLVSSNTHMWNYVQMEDGNWYMVDCTFDDPIGAGEGYIGENYFLVSNNPAVDQDHVTDQKLNYPETCEYPYVESDSPDVEVGVDAIKVKGMSLTIMDDGFIGLNYYVLIPEALREIGLKSYIGFNDETMEYMDISSMTPIENITEDGENGKINYLSYKMTYWIPSTHMTEKVSLKLLNNDDSVILEEAESITDYVKRLEKEELEEYNKNLPIITKMLNYGAAAQQYFGINTNTLANSVLPEDKRKVEDVSVDDIAQYQSHGIVGEEPIEGLSYLGTSLLLKSDMHIRHYFVLSENLDKKNLDVSIVDNQGNVQQTQLVQKGSVWYVDIEGISIDKIANSYITEISYGDRQVQLEYSIMSYLYKALSQENLDDTFTELLKTIYFLFY